MGKINYTFDTVVMTSNQIKNTIGRLADTLNYDYEGNNPIFVCVLKGSLFFFSDLVRELTFNTDIEFIRAKSYCGTESSDLTVDDINFNPEGRDIVIVEDIVDTGKTLSHLRKLFEDLGATSVKCVTLLYKPSKNVFTVQPEYVGKSIQDVFVVGYGMDYNEKYRNLNNIYALKEV